MNRTASAVLTPHEARRAIYFDFEGRTDKAPVLLGWYDGGAREVVVDAAFAAVARATEVPFDQLDYTLLGLVRAAEFDDRRLVAWSSHELVVARRALAGSPAQLRSLEDRYVDARLLARRWRNRLHPDWDFPRVPNGGRYRLARFLQLSGYVVPSMAGPGNTGHRLADLERLTERGVPYADWTPTQKAKWTNLRRHNLHDVLGMRHVCIRATDELAGI